MKVALFCLALLLPLPFAHAEDLWESCLDNRDFTFNADTFTRSTRLTKLGCRMTAVELGAKGRRYELNLCSPQIAIEAYPTLEATKPVTLYAGSSACPAPLFGADFHMPPDQKGAAAFLAEKKRVFEIAEWVREKMAPSISAKDADRLKTAPANDSDAQVACGLYLLNEYLESCVSFEEPKPTVPAKPKK